MTVESDHQAERNSKGRILVVDDHPLIRQGLIQLINSQPDMAVCGEASNGVQALDTVSEQKPDLAIVDIFLGETSGIDLVSDIKTRHPSTAVLVLSMYEESFYAERALQAGARGYLMKGGPLEDVMTAIRQVLKGEVYLSSKMAVKVVDRLVGKTPLQDASPLDILSNRELRVFELIGEGLGPSDIAQRLHLSVKTIETYRAHIKRKLKIEDATALRRRAIQWVQNRGQA